jgi:hypothetical protein
MEGETAPTPKIKPSIDEMPRVMLCMPGYNNGLTGGAARGFYRASRGDQAHRPVRLSLNDASSSLLAHNFNRLWTVALNAVHRGLRLDYFAMLHADVEPEEFWLDTLIDELEEQKLDVLGVAVPIKDHHGLTSIAVDREDPDSWRPRCRLTMREIFRLPETFTSRDVGGDLLINTGCWVCKFNMDWATEVYFTIRDRIVFDKSLGAYKPEVEPEDWFFSRTCHALGLRVGCTRKVKLDHAGSAKYRNTEPWGDPFDVDYISGGSTLPPTAAPEDVGFRFPSDVDGWLSYDEGLALSKLANGKDVLEIGSYCGRSTICMAQTANRVVAVDPFDGRGTPRMNHSTLESFKNNIERYGVAGKVDTLVGTADEALTEFDHYVPFDLVFIDGAHDADSVRNDISHARRLLKPDGLLAFHDYRVHPGQYDGRWDPGVTTAVDELVKSGGELLSVNSTVAVVRPPQPQRLEV